MIGIQLGAAFMLLVSSSTWAGDPSHFESRSGFDPSGLLTSGTAQEISVDSGKYNILATVPAVRRALESVRKEASDPGNELYRSIQRDDQFYEPQRKLLQEIGDSLTLTGRPIYYPFGGMDSHTPFLLDPRSTDVFVQTAEGFGQSEDLVRLGTLDKYGKAGGFWGPFDSIRDLAMMADEYQMAGSGAFATARIQRHLGGEVVGIYPFRLEKEGQISLQTLRPGEVAENALVVFRDPGTGSLKRFWHFQYRLGAGDGRFERLLERLKFGTMLIKGLPTMAFEGELRQNALRITTDQAIRNDAVVLSEVRLIGSYTDRGPSTPQPIFKKGGAVKTITFPDSVDRHFGYSYNGHPILFVGGKDALISSSTPESEVERRSVCEMRYASLKSN